MILWNRGHVDTISKCARSYHSFARDPPRTRLVVRVRWAEGSLISGAVPAGVGVNTIVTTCPVSRLTVFHSEAFASRVLAVRLDVVVHRNCGLFRAWNDEVGGTRVKLLAGRWRAVVHLMDPGIPGRWNLRRLWSKLRVRSNFERDFRWGK